MPEELKPCPNPKCGCKTPRVIKELSSDTEFFFAVCPDCSMAGPIEACSRDAAIAVWNNLPRASHITPNDADCKGCPERRPGLVWGTDLPTVPGWYWYTQSDFSRPCIVQLMFRGLDTDRLTASFAGNEEDEWVEDMVGRWAGPIPMPEELTS